jgi:hypothetical protein
MQGKKAEEYLKAGTMVPASMIIGEQERPSLSFLAAGQHIL